MPEHADRAFVLGLDGVPWDRLTGWLDAGHLPNFRRLREEGVAGPLESTMPPTTALAWPSIATGARPDKHGIYSFQRLESDYTHQMATSSDVTAPRLWDLVSPAVVGNVPMSYPATDIDGELVAGMMTPSRDEGFTHPPELRRVIEREIPDYEIGLTWSEYTDRPDAFQRDLDSLLDARRDLMRLLLDRTDWRLCFFVYTAPDRLQHLLWDDEVMLDHYRRLDDILGEVLDTVEAADATLLVVSDHGFGPISTHVAVNTVLEEGSHLTRREDTGARSVFDRVGVDKSTVTGALDRAGIDQERLLHALPDVVVDRLADSVPGSHVLYDVDFERTEAFVHGAGGVYVNDTDRFEQGAVDPADTERVKAAVAETFRSLTDPETGERVLAVHDGDDLFPTDEGSPDLVVRGIGEYQKVTGLRETVFSGTGGTQASHRREGVFFAWGPDIESGGAVRGATVFDVAPTVLHTLGEAVPAATDGEVLSDIFAPDSDPVNRPVAATERTTDEPWSAEATRDEDFEDVEERLRGLGYME